jgi:hypothetical protein
MVGGLGPAVVATAFSGIVVVNKLRERPIERSHAVAFGVIGITTALLARWRANAAAAMREGNESSQRSRTRTGPYLDA